MKIGLNPYTIQSADFEEQIRICGASGYDGLELTDEAVEKFLASGHRLADLRAKLIENRVEAIAVYGGDPFWAPGDGRERSRTIERLRRSAERSAALGAGLVTVNSMVDIPAVEAAEEIAEVCEAVGSLGARVAYEPLGFAPRFSGVREAAELVDRAGANNLGFVLDSFHLYRGGSPFHDIALVPRGRIYLAHIDDVVDVPRERMTDFDRVFPGDGILDLAVFVTKLREAAFDGFLSVEIFNREYWKRAPFAVAAEAKRKLDRLLPKGASS